MDSTQVQTDASFASAYHNGGTSTLILGQPGSGKTHALRTLLNLDIEVAGIFTEPRGMEILSDTDPEKFHWVYIAPQRPSWSSMLDSARKINSYSFEDLSKIKTGMDKQEYQQLMKLLGVCANYKCERCGKEMGAIDDWGPERAFFIDSMSGLNIMCMDLVTGAKPVKAMGEWGVAMDTEERLINKFCSDLRCWFVMTAHIEREQDEISGAQFNAPAALGRKLGPRIPRFFSDVVHSRRVEGSNFRWSTISPSMDLKARNLPWSDNIPPDFREIYNRWKARREGAIK